MGVPEIWRFDGERVTILLLAGSDYDEALASVALPSLTSEVLTRFMHESRSLRRTGWIRRIREWARVTIAQG